MKVGPYTRLGPNLPTMWGTYASPYILGEEPRLATTPAVRGSRPPGMRAQRRYIGPIGEVPGHQRAPFLGLGIFGALLLGGLAYVLLK